MTADVVTTIYVEATAERVWQALTDPVETATYWGNSNVSDWRVGSEWAHVDASGHPQAEGSVLESDPPRRLVDTWTVADAGADAPSVVTFEIDEHETITRLRVTHADLPNEADRAESAAGWAAVLSNLKTFVETGRPLSVEPWTVP